MAESASAMMWLRFSSAERRAASISRTRASDSSDSAPPMASVLSQVQPRLPMRVQTWIVSPSLFLAISLSPKASGMIPPALLTKCSASQESQSAKTARNGVVDQRTAWRVSGCALFASRQIA